MNSTDESRSVLEILIYDDDKTDINLHHKLITKYLDEREFDYNITDVSSQDDYSEYLKSKKPDIILLDIEMEFVDGMTAATKIREVDQDVIIIFITNMPQYAINGYQVGALDYILKPLSYYAFSQTMKRAIGRRKSSEKRYIVASERGIKQKIDASEILYVEVINHDLIFHTKNGIINSKGTMKETMNMSRSLPSKMAR